MSRPNTRRKQKERKQSKPLNLSAICACILYTHVMSILAQLLGHGSAGLGPGQFSWDKPPPSPASSSSSPFPVQSVDTFCGDKVAQQLAKPPLSERRHEKEMQPDIRNGFKGEK